MKISDCADKIAGLISAVGWTTIASRAADGSILASIVEPASGAVILATQFAMQLQQSRNDVCATAINRIRVQTERSIEREIGRSSEFAEPIRKAFEDFDHFLPSIRPSIADLVGTWRLNPEAIVSGILERFEPLSEAFSSNHVARQAITGVIVEAVISFKDDPDLYRKLEPSIARQMLGDMGWVRTKLTGIEAEQRRQGLQIDKTTALVEQLAAQMGLLGRGQVLDDATRSDLLALLSDIIGQGITFDQLAPALATAKANLEKLRGELEQLRSLANEVPEIGPHLAAARAALDNRHQIDLGAAQDAIRKAKMDYREAVSARRQAEAINMARLSEAEASIALARSDFLEAARLFADAAEELPEAEKHLAAEQRFKQAGALLNHGERFGGLTSLQQAIDAYRVALTVYTEKDMPAKWAETQNCLGNSFSILGNREGGEGGRESLQHSLDAYRAALTVYVEKDMHAQWAKTQNNLGNSLSVLGEFEGGEAKRRSLKQAVDAYRDALSVLTREDMPADWAMTHANLGNALSRLGNCEGGEAKRQGLKQAIDAYRDALSVLIDEDMSVQRATIQNNLGIALLGLGEFEGGEAKRQSLKQAIDAYRDALSVRTEKDMPAQWAMTQHNLGNALLSLGNCEGGEAKRQSLKQAVDAYRDALTVYTEKDMPAKWAMTHANLGNALQNLGNHEGGSSVS